MKKYSIMGVAAANAQPQFHVLAVDDSLMDRKLIEKLLKTYSYQGSNLILSFLFHFLDFPWSFEKKLIKFFVCFFLNSYYCRLWE